MSVSQQRKGRAGELELVRVLNDNGVPAAPGDPASYGRTPDVIGVPGIHVECKRVERLNIDAAMDQAARDATKFKDGSPAVFHRKNRREWLVTMRLSDWIGMLKGNSMDEYKEIFKDIYNYMSRHVQRPRDYDAIMEEGEALAQKYGGMKFVVKLISAIWGELESS